jgi:mannose-1-phosphate guanylyltransferase
MKLFFRKQNKPDRWAVILAGGDGARLRSFTRTITGDDRPKQFAPVIGGQTLLDQTRKRAALSVPEERTLLVVTKTHERFYRHISDGANLLVQPENKGTAPGIIYPLMRIAAMSPDALVAVFPSDHYFSNDQEFMSCVDVGFETAQRRPETVTLLGITPESPEVEFGWIEPKVVTGSKKVARVRRFWEKPSLGVARLLMERGCLWNSFVMIGRVDAFLRIIKQALPELFGYFDAIVPVFGTPAEFVNLKTLYWWLRDVNFSHEVLALRPDALGVIKVDNVGWSDLGDPSRVLATLSRIGSDVQAARNAS